MANESLVSAKIGPDRACYREADDDKGIATTANCWLGTWMCEWSMLEKGQTTEYWKFNKIQIHQYIFVLDMLSPNQVFILG